MIYGDERILNGLHSGRQVMKINDVDVTGVASHDEMARIFREERQKRPLEVRIQVEKAPKVHHEQVIQSMLRSPSELRGNRSPSGSIGSGARGGGKEGDTEVSRRFAGTRTKGTAPQQVPAGGRKKRSSDEALCAACNKEPLLTEGCFHRCRTCRARLHGAGMCKVVARWADDDVLFCSEECKNPEDAGPHTPSGGPPKPSGGPPKPSGRPQKPSGGAQKPSVTGGKRGRKGNEEEKKRMVKKPRGGEKKPRGGDESDENDYFAVEVRTQKTRSGHQEGSQEASSASEEVNDMFA